MENLDKQSAMAKSTGSTLKTRLLQHGPIGTVLSLFWKLRRSDRFEIVARIRARLDQRIVVAQWGRLHNHLRRCKMQNLVTIVYAIRRIHLEYIVYIYFCMRFMQARPALLRHLHHQKPLHFPFQPAP